MKKILALIFLFPSIALAEHLIPRDAGFLTVGLLPNARLDPSSVTLLGPNVFTLGATTTLTGNLTLIGTNTFTGKNTFTNSDIGIPVFTSMTIKNYFDVVLGSTNAQGVDIASSTSAGLKEAIDRLEARGGGTVLVRPGTYIWSGVTVSANISIYAIPGTSVTIKHDSGILNIPILYMDGDNSGLYNLTISQEDLIISTPSIMVTRQVTIKNCRLMNNINSVKGFIHVDHTSNTYIDVSFQKYKGIVRTTFWGDNAPIVIERSSNTTLNVSGAVDYRPTALGNTTIGIINSSWTNVNLNMQESGGILLVISSSSKNTYITGNVRVTNSIPPSGNGLILLDPDPGTLDLSTFTYINNLNIYINIAGTWSVFRGEGRAGPPRLEVNGLRITNSVIHCNIANSITVFNMATAPTFNTIITGNQVYGCSAFIANSGTGTKYTGLGNFLNGAEQ